MCADEPDFYRIKSDVIEAIANGNLNKNLVERLVTAAEEGGLAGNWSKEVYDAAIEKGDPKTIKILRNCDLEPEGCHINSASLKDNKSELLRALLGNNKMLDVVPKDMIGIFVDKVFEELKKEGKNFNEERMNEFRSLFKAGINTALYNPDIDKEAFGSFIADANNAKEAANIMKELGMLQSKSLVENIKHLDFTAFVKECCVRLQRFITKGESMGSRVSVRYDNNARDFVNKAPKKDNGRIH